METCNSCLKEMICHNYQLEIPKVDNFLNIYLCKRCLLYGVSQIHGKMVEKDPIGGKTCFHCGVRKKLEEYDEKKGKLKSWCRDCCENESKRLKKAVKCACGKFAGESGICGECERKAIEKLQIMKNCLSQEDS